MKVCAKCGQPGTFPPNKRSPDGLDYVCHVCRAKLNAGYRAEDPERANASTRKSFRKLRDEVIDGYGGKCSCCGETEPRFLTLDHVNNDGAEHRREVGRNTYQMHRFAKANGYPPSLQVLCFNCNCGRRVNGGVCPHQLA